LPYHLSGIVEKPENLVLMSPEKFSSQYKIDARTSQEVMSIDREKKEVTVKKVETGETYTESYDKLILSPGAKPIVPPIKGLENVNTFTVRNVVDINKLNLHVKGQESKDVVVIGGGFIGVECAENLKEAGFNVSLVEATNQIMRPFDYDMVQIFHKELYDQGVNLIVEDKVVAFEKDTVVLESGKTLHAPSVVMAIGVTPDIDLAKEAGIEIGKTGAIKTSQNYQTNDKDI
jgi:NADPH-dependent 2,4-dienoyl-CoA reductase/sulfur reductase-like enzyme